MMREFAVVPYPQGGFFYSVELSRVDTEVHPYFYGQGGGPLLKR